MAGIQTDIDAQYLYPSTSHTMTYPPAFNTEESFMLSETHALMGRMQNAHLTRPNLSTEIWAADGGAAVGHKIRYTLSVVPPTGLRR